MVTVDFVKPDKVEKVSLGKFAGNSFGQSGNPSKAYLFLAVHCPRNSGDFSLPQYTFFCDPGDAQNMAIVNRKADDLAAEEREYEKQIAALQYEAMKKLAALREAYLGHRRGWDGFLEVAAEQGNAMAIEDIAKGRKIIDDTCKRLTKSQAERFRQRVTNNIMQF